MSAQLRLCIVLERSSYGGQHTLQDKLIFNSNCYPVMVLTTISYVCGFDKTSLTVDPGEVNQGVHSSGIGMRHFTD